MTETTQAPVARDITPVDPAYFVPGRFAGKTILMTGASRGIGKATAVRAAREGANVVVADILQADGEQTVAEIVKEGGRAIFVQIDVRQDADNARMVAEAVKTYGRLDLALNGAGVMDGVPPSDPVDVPNQKHQIFASIHEATDEYWDHCFAVNVKGMFYSMRHELRQMLKQNNGGAIVNIGSIAGLIGLAGTPAYNASKFAVTGLTRNAAIDYAPYGIRVNSVNMAGTVSPMTDTAYAKVVTLETERAQNPALSKIPNMGMFKTLSPLGYCDSKHRMSSPEEQAAVFLFLLSPEASNITGAAWATDGGWTAI